MNLVTLGAKEVMGIGERLANEFGAEGPKVAFNRKLYRPFVYERQDVYDLVDGGAVISLRFELVADDETLNKFIDAIEKSLEGALVDTETRNENVDDRIIPLRKVQVTYHVR